MYKRLDEVIDAAVEILMEEVKREKLEATRRQSNLHRVVGVFECSPLTSVLATV